MFNSKENILKISNMYKEFITSYLMFEFNYLIELNEYTKEQLSALDFNDIVNQLCNNDRLLDMLDLYLHNAIINIIERSNNDKDI